jgi:SpoVK/Ycf46/Vps4 family AAA+-type ATPase
MVTPEESRAELEIRRVAAECARNLFTWSFTDGLINVNTKAVEKTPTPEVALQLMYKKEEGSIFVVRDLHAFFKSPGVVRILRDMGRDFKQSKKNVILLSPLSQIPPELERDVVMVDFDLPTKDQIAEIWDLLYEQNEQLFERVAGSKPAIQQALGLEQKGTKVILSEDERDRIIAAALGMTSVETENAFSKATVTALRAASVDEEPLLISRLVMKEKANAVKKSGVLEYFEASEQAGDIGGLDILKRWLDMRGRAFSKKAREFGLPLPKGILLVGLPGCGKSLTAKAASNVLGVPLIRFDISRVFGGIVGQSEQQMRSALQTIERVGQCVVWIDEAEKAFAGAGGSGSHDSGVTKRVFGNFLTFMQEKKGAAFVVMTVNNIESIQQSSPEMLRKGRFDEIFFVGLPSSEEREQIFSIHIRRNKRNPANFDLKRLAKAAEGFSGAEIEQAVVEGLYKAFYAGNDLTTAYIVEACDFTNPLSRSAEHALNSMKEWAERNAVNASLNGKDEGHAGRALQI